MRPKPSGLYVAKDLYPIVNYTDYVDTTDRTTESATLSGGEKTLLMFAFGQSRMTNFGGTTTYTPTNASKVQQINVFDGTVYRMKDPVLGMGGSAGCYLSRLGDKLIDAGVCARVICVPFAITSTSTANWLDPSLHKSRIETAARRARGLGYAAPNANLIKCALWEQGHTDAINGVSSATYQANVEAIQRVLADQGFAVPFFVATSTVGSTVVGAPDATINAAQQALWNPSELRPTGPDLDSLLGANLQDTIHFSTTGLGNAADLWKTAIQNYFGP